jgi:hypothetical protein
MDKQNEYEERPLDTQPGTPEFEARFKRLWKQYRDWFNENGVSVDATKWNYRNAKIGIRLSIECNKSDKEILDFYIMASSLNQYMRSSVCC